MAIAATITGDLVISTLALQSTDSATLPRSPSIPSTITKTAPPAPTRLLPSLTPDEPHFRRALYAFLIAFLSLGFFITLLAWWVPAHPGVDQNGYLVGGKMFSDHLSMGLTPPDPYSFVGRMWITTQQGTFYPKYPLGLPLLYAFALWIGQSHGVYLAHLISPISMSLSLVGIYLLLRQILPLFPSLLGVIVVAASPVTLALTDNPNSHAATLCCVVWGMYFLFRWWRTDNLWFARAAGLLVGYAATIRYTEAMLVLPLALVAAMRFSNRRSLRDGAILLLWWFIPIAILLTFNLCWFGHLTGYDPTNESTGFSWAYFQNNWQTMLRTMYDNGLIFIFPFALAGLASMFWWNWRVASVLASWVLPSLLLYTAYYWAPDTVGTSYIRFFLTILPPLVLAAMWLMTRTIAHGKLALPIVAGLIVALSAVMSAYAAIPILDQQYRSSISVYEAGEHALASIPAGSFVFSDSSLLHHLQFIQNYRLYNFEPFSRSSLRLMNDFDPDRPQGLQPDRAKAIYNMLKDESDYRLTHHQNFLMNLAHTLDHRVFFIGPRRNVDELRHRFVPPTRFQSTIVDEWTDAAGSIPRAFDKRAWRGGFNGALQRDRTPPPSPAVEWVILEITPIPGASPDASPPTDRNSSDRRRFRDRR